MISILHWALLAIVALAPLPLASNRPWSWSLLSLAVGALLLSWVALALRDSSALAVPWRRLRWAVACFVPLILWFLFQASPFAPAGWQHELWPSAAEALGRPISGAIALDPEAARTATMRIVGYGGIFWLALQLGRDPARARRAIWAVAIAGALYAAYGLVIEFGGYRSILWYDKWAYRDSLTSTFVNRNSFATYAGLALLATMVLLVAEVQRAMAPRSEIRAGFRQILDQLGPGFFILIVAFAVIFTALLLSRSRGGFLSMVIGAVVLGATLLVRRRRRGGAALTMLAAGIGAYVIFAVSGESTLTRLADIGADFGGRGVVYDVALGAIKDRPWLGTGLGSFESVFQIYRDDRLGPAAVIYDKAHNSYIEFAVEAGLPGLAMMLILLCGLAGLCLGGAFRRRQDALFPILGISASALVATHAAVDFSLQIPAVAAAYMLVLGTGCAQSWRMGSGRTRQDPSR